MLAQGSDQEEEEEEEEGAVVEDRHQLAHLQGLSDTHTAGGMLPGGGAQLAGEPELRIESALAWLRSELEMQLQDQQLLEKLKKLHTTLWELKLVCADWESANPSRNGFGARARSTCQVKEHISGKMFYMQLLMNKRGPLSKIWLAAHWDKKVTKAHIFECNLEATIEKILSPKDVIKLHHPTVNLMLCIFLQGLLTSLREILRQIMMPSHCLKSFMILTPNFQTRNDEIEIPRHGSFFSDSLINSSNSLLADHSSLNLTGDKMALGYDGFGDEGAGRDMIGKYEQNPNGLLAIFDMEEELLLPNKDPVDNRKRPTFDLDQAASKHKTRNHQLNETTLLCNEEDGFVLCPIVDSALLKKQRSKRKRKLLVDTVKQLSKATMQKQLTSYTDTLTALHIAPPTRKLMILQELGSVDKLLTRPTQPCFSEDLQRVTNLRPYMLFSLSLYNTN
ncbi:hypothetical protein Chor_005512 [Crotalus horridus]